jgi:endo-1,4-beta-xylanase
MKIIHCLLFICFTSFISAQQPIAAGRTKFIGNIYSNTQINNFTKYWNQVTPENGGKWGSVESTRDVMNWSELDAAYKLAKDNGFYYKHHVLIWGNQQPAWIEGLSTEEQKEEIVEWFKAVAQRYPNIDAIEVVNEPVNDPPVGGGNGNYLAALGGSGTTGYDWIINAFTMAREYFPKTKLMINEYGVENTPATLTKYLAIVKLLEDRGLVDQVGFQAHAFSTTGTAASLKAFVDKLDAATKLPLYVTELDIDGPTDAQQLADYKKIFTVLWEHPAIQGITFWGWRPGLWRNAQKAYIIDGSNVERPSLQWLRTFVESSNIALDVVEELLADIFIYPNPVVNRIVHLKTEESINQYQLIDQLGREIQKGSIIDKQINLNQNILGGNYFLVVKNEKNQGKVIPLHLLD